MNIEIKTITLDEFCEENNILPDVVKMDVEGAELLALRGMYKIIKKCDNLKMFIEFERNKKKLYDSFSKYFDIFRITKDGKGINMKICYWTPNAG